MRRRSSGAGASIAPSAVLGPRVVLGARVAHRRGRGHRAPGLRLGVRAPAGAVRAVPQLGGVVIEDDVVIGPLCTIDAGTLGPTRIRRGAKLDAHVHVGHNGDIGEGTIVAAQCGFAGSVTIGRGVLVGGQVGHRRPRPRRRRRAHRRQERRHRRCTGGGRRGRIPGRAARALAARARDALPRRRARPTPVTLERSSDRRSRSTASCRSCRTAGRSCSSTA